MSNEDYNIEIQEVRGKIKYKTRLIVKNKLVNVKQISELFSILRKAFEINYQAHLSRNRNIEIKNINNILWKRISNTETRMNRNRMYEHKIRLLERAIKLIEDENINIEYGLKDDVLMFKYNREMITFHTVGKIECKSTDLVWDGKKHKNFPFRY